MRSSDWSSDVCSSDLEAVDGGAVVGHAVIAGELDLLAADAARGLYDGARDDGHEGRAARGEQVVALVEAAARAGEAPVVHERDPTLHRAAQRGRSPAGAGDAQS